MFNRGSGDIHYSPKVAHRIHTHDGGEEATGQSIFDGDGLDLNSLVKPFASRILSNLIEAQNRRETNTTEDQEACFFTGALQTNMRTLLSVCEQIPGNGRRRGDECKVPGITPRRIEDERGEGRRGDEPHKITSNLLAVEQRVSRVPYSSSFDPLAIERPVKIVRKEYQVIPWTWQHREICLRFL